MPDHGARQQRVQHTRCVQMDIMDLRNQAVSVFSAKQPDGSLPLVLIPPARSKWMPSALFVPAGCKCLLQHWGAAKGVASQGAQVYSPFWRVAYCVTQQSCTYSAPVNRVPTSDNVMVSVDLMVVFRISDPEKFVYTLGAEVFDTAMSGILEEGVRHLVRNTDSAGIWKLRGSKAGTMLDLVNKKFNDFGVICSDCKVLDVILPKELAQALERTTAMEKSMAKIAKAQEFAILEISQKSEMEVEAEKKQGEQRIVAEHGKKSRSLIARNQMLVQCEQSRQVATMKAEEQAQVAIGTAAAALERKKTDLEGMKVTQISAARAKLSQIKSQADVEFNQIATQAKSRLAETKYAAEALDSDAGAERDAAAHLTASRTVELQMQQMEVLQKIAGDAQFNLIGEAGDRIINSILLGLAPPPPSSGLAG